MHFRARIPAPIASLLHEVAHYFIKLEVQYPHALVDSLRPIFVPVFAADGHVIAQHPFATMPLRQDPHLRLRFLHRILRYDSQSFLLPRRLLLHHSRHRRLYAIGYWVMFRTFTLGKMRLKPLLNYFTNCQQIIKIIKKDAQGFHPNVYY